MRPVNLLLIIGLVSIITLTGCKKDEYMTEATITGWDQRYCQCCGGLQINFQNEIKPYSGDFYDLTNSASSLGLSDTVSTFPIYMYVNWTHPSTIACPNIITITKYERL